MKTIDKAAYSDDVYVVLADWPGKIKCYFAKSNAGQASQLSKGEVITVKGMCDGKFGNEVELKDVVFNKVDFTFGLRSFTDRSSSSLAPRYICI